MNLPPVVPGRVYNMEPILQAIENAENVTEDSDDQTYSLRRRERLDYKTLHRYGKTKRSSSP